jgi:hypothetical protein
VDPTVPAGEPGYISVGYLIFTSELLLNSVYLSDGSKARALVVVGAGWGQYSEGSLWLFILLICGDDCLREGFAAGWWVN